MLDTEFIKTHNLEECLREFKGADGKEENLGEQFELLAKKLLFGGHFEVRCGKQLIRSIYLYTIEFYYHEERGPIKDYIVYHRNPEDKGIILPPFPLGSLNAHQSGVDITFEDWRSGNNPQYRASALIRAVKVKEGHDESFRTFRISGKKGLQKIDPRSTYVYEYLFMGAPVSDIHIQWIQNDMTDDNPIPLERVNVCEYDPDTHTKKLKTQDPRKWGYTRQDTKD